MSSNIINKVVKIVEAAQIRFGLYGVEKTSMREIADDLKLSKASLYYYFPDKESLYKAVVEKEQNEFITRVKERILSIQDPEQLLREYANTRLSYFRALLNLSRLRLEAYADLKPVFKETLILFTEKEKEIVVQILKKGISDGLFNSMDTDQTASLFLDVLRGLRISVVTNKRTLFIDEKEFEILLHKTISFTNIFIRGLKNKY